MIAAAYALPVAMVTLFAGDFVNRRVRGWLPDDPPRPGRKQHERPIPLAGVLLPIALSPWLVPTAAPWLLSAVVVATTTGFVDDWHKERHRELGWRPKTVALGFAAMLAAAAWFPPWQQPTAWLLATAWVFVLTNATNFLDNTDGVCAALSAVSLWALGADAAAWSALAFLPWNWPRPRLFLGDSGAYALGLLVGAHSLPWANHQLAAVAVQCADFVQVVVARLVLGVPPWVGDRRHLTHVVQNLGLPRIAVAPLFAAIAGALAFCAR
ncbi:MAG: MraY family glycosyltransferase [Planctomycetota bacterium]